MTAANNNQAFDADDLEIEYLLCDFKISRALDKIKQFLQEARKS